MGSGKLLEVDERLAFATTNISNEALILGFVLVVLH
jgi:hypothetical protein